MRIPAMNAEVRMDEVRNYTMNFSYGLTCRTGKLAFAEVHRFVAPPLGVPPRG